MNQGSEGQLGDHPAASPPGGGSGFNASGKVAGPAIGLIITAAIGIALNLISIVWKLVFGMASALGGGEEGPAKIMAMLSGPIGILFGLLAIGVGVVVLIGALKMKALESYALAMAATILAMIPCISPCCILGIPIGIWSLVVLLDSNVKASFRS